MTRSAALSGRHAGMACAVGIGAGVFAWSAVTAAAFAGLLAASAVAVFFIALVPQFLPQSPTILDTVVLGAIMGGLLVGLGIRIAVQTN